MKGALRDANVNARNVLNWNGLWLCLMFLWAADGVVLLKEVGVTITLRSAELLYGRRLRSTGQADHFTSPVDYNSLMTSPFFLLPPT